MTYSGPVHKIEQRDSYEGLRRLAKEVATRKIITGEEFRRDIAPAWLAIAGLVARIWAAFELLAYLAKIGVLHAL